MASGGSFVFLSVRRGRVRVDLFFRSLPRVYNGLGSEGRGGYLSVSPAWWKEFDTFREKEGGMWASLCNAPVWQRNLWACAAVAFIISAGMSQLAPLLPLYIHEMGVENLDEVAEWSGIAYGCNFISLALFSPLWGALADAYGRKPMVLRATLWLSVCMCLMGLAQNVWQLTGLRLVQGALSGFQGAVIPLVMAMTPETRSGWAMSILVSGQVSGARVGPLIGGWISQTAGIRENFFIMAACALAGFLVILFFVREEFTRPAAEGRRSWKERYAFPVTRPLALLFLTTFAVQFALMSIAPIITVYVKHLVPESEHVALLAGFVFAATGLASILTATAAGRCVDRRGPRRVLPVCLICAGLICIPHVFVRNPYELGALRFLLGLASVGILPAVNSLLKSHTPPEYFSRVFSANFSHQSLGIFAGSLLGGHVASWFGVEHVFYLSAAMLLLNACAFLLFFPRSDRRNEQESGRNRA